MARSIRLIPYVICLLALGIQPGVPSANEGDSVVNLEGRWAGEGTMVPASGPNENFRCVVTYFLNDDASRVRQNLRCQGANYKFDAGTRLQIEDGKVTGVWADNVYSLNGTVTGIVTAKGFDILLRGQFFQAKMTVVSSDCQQSVKVVPDRADYMRELAAVLKKC